MLRTRVDYKALKAAQEEAQRHWRVSSGTAAVLGLISLRLDCAPTTAYLMLGERCQRNCAFCTQARESVSGDDTLSRVSWPEFESDAVAEAVAKAYLNEEVSRACFQVTVSTGYLERTQHAIQALSRKTRLPICASVAPRCAEDVQMLLQAGAQRVTIALDAACERVYREVKGGSWTQVTVVLEECARRFPGRIGTHLIVGLGETEREMVERLQYFADRDVRIGLFAFTAVPGTTLARREPPELSHYRRMQAARWLIENKLARAESLTYDAASGQLSGFGLSAERLRELLATGEAFRTAGCPGCNRPYYNERPGGVMYNYPRPLTPEEATKELDTLIGSLAQ